ncbi:unnamed protein product (macronuclear) [Paramecium tetraurelia]|uniref:Uncharacterized protein n=1 Tax=Paramecium tetraurelia TaxID=5888 RepID=A0E9Y1_PARTE|nr:uncharacterized protein GSPATT00024829001 [Paramecium tetraurelia]CAK92098.1 unnamed protein product [Paramecium tetraurelia]|eukprot:XP_001459495.1 hypothetical protein (macronuclear) [Paramecium tetraurelia strain d4-2]
MNQLEELLKKPEFYDNLTLCFLTGVKKLCAQFENRIKIETIRRRKAKNGIRKIKYNMENSKYQTKYQRGRQQ